MPAPVVIHGFETSNNFKVRVALGYKGIPFEFKPIDPANRDDMRELTGQPMTPVMVHGDVVLFDSAAIIRYLEANFPDTPRLFSADYSTMREIERWETFGRSDLAGPLMRLVMLRMRGVDDPAERAAASSELATAAATLDVALEGREWLVGDAMTAADVTCGAVVYRILAHDLLPAPDGADRVRAWAWRVMEYDPLVD